MLRTLILGFLWLVASCGRAAPIYDSEAAVPDNCERLVGVASTSDLGSSRAVVLEGCWSSVTAVGGNALVLLSYSERAQADNGTWGARCTGIAYSCK